MLNFTCGVSIWAGVVTTDLGGNFLSDLGSRMESYAPLRAAQKTESEFFLGLRPKKVIYRSNLINAHFLIIILRLIFTLKKYFFL